MTRSAAIDPLPLIAGADLLLLLATALRSPELAARAPAGDHGVAGAGVMSDEEDPIEELARLGKLDRRATATLRRVADLLERRDRGLVVEHARLFEAGGCCPPNETAYIRRDKGAVLADLCGFYRAFGFEPAPGTGEKADHIVTELQFMSLLLILAVRAASDAATAAELAVTLQALRSFAGDHLGAWLPSFAAHLHANTQQPLLRDTADLLLAVWNSLCRRLDLPQDAPAEVLAPRDEPSEATWPCHLPEPP